MLNTNEFLLSVVDMGNTTNAGRRVLSLENVDAFTVMAQTNIAISNPITFKLQALIPTITYEDVQYLQALNVNTSDLSAYDPPIGWVTIDETTVAAADFGVASSPGYCVSDSGRAYKAIRILITNSVEAGAFLTVVVATTPSAR